MVAIEGEGVYRQGPSFLEHLARLVDGAGSRQEVALPVMPPWFTLAVSALALAVSAVTAWLTLFRRGDLRMTQPTVVFFGPDGGSRGDEPRLKVFLRTLLYSTARSGQTVESMYVNVQRGETRQNFSVWVYGEEHLARGSGLYVGQEGLACNHHFLLPEDGASFSLVAGTYTMRVFAKRVTDAAPRELSSVRLTISDAHAAQLRKPHAGIYFDWGPDQQAYHAHVEERRPRPLPPWLLDAATAASAPAPDAAPEAL